MKQYFDLSTQHATKLDYELLHCVITAANQWHVKSSYEARVTTMLTTGADGPAAEQG